MVNPTRLVRWMPKLVEPTAKDIALYGPPAARVRTLLDFIPTMSDDAVRISDAATISDETWDAVRNEVNSITRNDPWYQERREATEDAWNTAFGFSESDAPWNAGTGELLSHRVRPETYRTLTNPLAAGRAVDVLRPRSPENFLDVVSGLGEGGGIQRPADVLSARRISQVDDKVARSEILDLILNYGMSPEEAIIAVRALG